MKKQSALSLIGPAISKIRSAFSQYDTLIDSTAIYLFPNQNRLFHRNELAEKLGARRKADLDDTSCEAILGKDGYAVIIYYQLVNEINLPHFLYHEFGHVISLLACKELFMEAEATIDNGELNPLRSGMSVWSELIAKAIAYRIENAAPSPVTWEATKQIELLLDEAVNDGKFSPYPFAFYCAMFFEDPTILSYFCKYPNAAVGADHCDDEIVPLIQDALSITKKQLEKPDYWVISRDTLNGYGECVDSLWDYCNLRFASKMLKERMSAFLENN